MEKNPHASAGEVRDGGLIPESGRSPGGERGNPHQYSCLENPTEDLRGTSWVMNHKVAEVDMPEAI